MYASRSYLSSATATVVSSPLQVSAYTSFSVPSKSTSVFLQPRPYSPPESTFSFLTTALACLARLELGGSVFSYFFESESSLTFLDLSAFGLSAFLSGSVLLVEASALSLLLSPSSAGLPTYATASRSAVAAAAVKVGKASCRVRC